MAAGWSVMDAINRNSKAAAEDRPKARFRTRDISVKKMYSNDMNFYSRQDIEELSNLILAVGLIENMAVTYDPCEKGEYRIISGEMRWRALNLLLEKGYSEFEVATCQILTPAEEHEEMVQIIVANSYRTKNIKDQLEEAQKLKESLQYMKEHGLTLQGMKLDGKKIRDVVANIMKLSGTKVAQIDGINSNLLPEFVEQLKEGKLTFSAAYELSGMSKEDQEEMLKAHEEGEAPTWKEVREAKRPEPEDVSESDTLPGQMEYPKDYEKPEDEEESDQEEEQEQEQPTPVSVERINNFVGKASEKEMEQIDIALLIGLGIKLAGAENQSGGASRKSEQQIQSSVKDRSKEESEKMAEENQMLREELKKQQESTIRSEAECSAYKAMHEQLLKKLMERRE